ncbi:hypothetical protein ACRAWD_13130 [Caulobacter segnis]
MTITADYRRDIDGLRAVAVAAIVVHHAFPALLPGGASSGWTCSSSSPAI